MIPLPDNLRRPPAPVSPVHSARDETAVDAAVARAAARLHGLQFNPEHGYYGWKGEDAADGHATIRQVAHEIVRDARQSLAGERRRALFDGAIRPILDRTLASLAGHAAAEAAGLHATAAKARLEAAIRDAAAHPGDDGRFAHAVFTADGESRRLAAIHGWDQPTTQAFHRAGSERAHAARLLAIAQIDPNRALEFFRANRDQFDPRLGAHAEPKLTLLAKSAKARALAEAVLRGETIAGTPGVRPTNSDFATHFSAWRSHANLAATACEPGDCDFANEVLNHVQGHVERLNSEAAAKDRDDRNLLLTGALDPRRPRDEAELLALDPRLKLAWVDARPEVRAGIRARLRHNARGYEPPLDGEALRHARWAEGLRHAHPEAFRRLDLAHSVYRRLPADLHQALLDAQTDANPNRGSADRLRRLTFRPRRHG